MLNDTVISVTQMLSPLWSEQIVKYFILDYRYCTVFTLLFNGFSNMIAMSEKAASIIIACVFVFLSLYLYVRKYSGLLFRFASNNKGISIVTGFNSEKELIVDIGNSYIERFLHDNQEYFLQKPRWVCGGHDILKSGKEDSNYVVGSGNVYLQDGTYNVVIDKDVCFSIVVFTSYGEKKLSTRTLSLQFTKGNVNDLFRAMTTREKLFLKKENPYIFSYPIGTLIGTLENCQDKQGKKSTFFGYYNPKLDTIIDWIDSLNRPAKYGQSRQFSILCHGKSGTGKTSIVKRIAEYTNRNILLVNLLEIKKKKNLINLFYSADGYCEDSISYFSDIENTIFFIDEFDKTIKKLKILKENKTKKEENFYLLLKSNEKQSCDNEPRKNEKKDCEFDWDIDDLLEIFCGSYIPDKRMIIAACNDIQSINEDYPYLARPGRLTPIEFDYGNKDLFIRMVKDYTDIDMELGDFDKDYRFTQAHLIEYLNYKINVSREDILSELDMFRVK
jgi:hypothetical protein